MFISFFCFHWESNCYILHLFNSVCLASPPSSLPGYCHTVKAHVPSLGVQFFMMNEINLHYNHVFTLCEAPQTVFSILFFYDLGING